MRRTILCAAALGFSLSAVAQTKVCMGGDLATLSAAERTTCENQVRMVQRSNAASKVSAGWHFVVVCGETGWKEYAAFSQQGEAQTAEAAADTDFATKTTFLRGARLLTQDAAELVVARSLQVASVDAIQVALR